MREKQSAAAFATEAPLATQREDERQDDPARQLRRDRIVLRPRNLMARARLASSRTFDGHERCRFSGEWRRFRTIIQSHCRHARRLERRPPARRALRFSEKCAGSEIGAPRLPAESSQCAKAPTALPPAGGGAIRFGASKKIRLIIFRTFRFMVCPGCGTFLQRGSSPPPPWRPQPGRSFFRQSNSSLPQWPGRLSPARRAG